jgi:hypothetical protein
VPDDEIHVAQGDFSKFDEARRRLAEEEKGPSGDLPPAVVQPEEPDLPEEPVDEVPAAEVLEPPTEGAEEADESTPEKREERREPQLIEVPRGGATPRPLELPQSSPRRGAGRRRPGRNVLVALAVILVIAILAVGGIVLAGGGDDNSDKASAPPKSAAEKPAARKPAKNKPSSPKPKPKPAVGTLASWPSREGWTAVAFASPSDKAGATAAARKAAKLGLTAGVLRSDRYPSLQAGAWVTFAGVYPTQAGAQKAADRLKAGKVAASPYVRFVGKSPR